MNGYIATNAWYRFVADNPRKTKATHHALINWCFALANEKGWPDEFQFPTDEAMQMSGIVDKESFANSLKDLVSFGCIKILQESKNRYVARWIQINGLKFYLSVKPSASQIPTPDAIPGAKPDASPIPTPDANLPNTKEKETNINSLNFNKPIKDISVEKNFDDAEEKNKAAGFWAKPASQESGQPIEEKKEEPSSKVPRKVSPAKSPEEYTLVHQIKLLVEKMQVGYYWQAKDAANAKSLVKQMTHSFKIRNEGSEPTNEELINSFLMLVDLLPPFYADKWDMGILTSQYNAIIKQIRENANKAKTNSGGGHKPGNTKLVGIEETLRRIAARYPPNDQPAP